ncbi:hypothetical protein SprV_0200833600 [Sparganum proliferum]
MYFMSTLDAACLRRWTSHKYSKLTVKSTMLTGGSQISEHNRVIDRTAEFLLDNVGIITFVLLWLIRLMEEQLSCDKETKTENNNEISAIKRLSIKNTGTNNTSLEFGNIPNAIVTNIVVITFIITRAANVPSNVIILYVAVAFIIISVASMFRIILTNMVACSVTNVMISTVINGATTVIINPMILCTILVLAFLVIVVLLLLLLLFSSSLL